MKAAIAIAVGLALVSLTGCAGLGRLSRPDAVYRFYSDIKAPVIPPTGLVYTDVHAPLALDGGLVGGLRKGRATTHRIGLPPFLGLLVGVPIPAVGIVSWGDASEKAAARNGGITHITYADYNYRIILFVYQRFTTEVYGN